MFSWWKRRKKEATTPKITRVAQQVPIYAPPPAFELDVSIQTDVGCLRAINEDRGRFIRPGDPEAWARKGGLAIVADGMGGHASGEVASTMAVDVLPRVYYDYDGTPHEALRVAFLAANRAIYEAAPEETRHRGMGTTCTALVIRGDEAFSAHVGDSRLYLVRQGKLHALSEDHSVVRDMVRQGLITHEEARHHEYRNVITRALGLHPDVAVATWPKPLQIQEGDWFILSSDGLHDLVRDEEIQDVTAAATPHDASEQLIALAKARGGHDNITVGMVRIRKATPETPRREPDTREVEALQ